MALTVALILWLVVAALLGLLRGVRAGLLALAGTLLAAALVELWAEGLAGWVRATFRPELPAAPTFAVTAAAFLAAAGLLGYGGAALLPRAGAGAPPLAERGLGALLGALNGALAAAYLLRYALASWGEREAAALAVAASPLAGALVAWLPWYVLAVVGALGGLVLWRLARRMAGRAPAGGAAAGGSVAAAPTLSEADRRLSDKINQALKK